MENDQLKRFLELNPKPGEIFSASAFDLDKNINGALTKDIFYSKLFYEDNYYSMIKRNFGDIIESPEWNNRLIFLSGFSGIGKTTFLQTFINEFSKKYENFYIDFQRVLVNIGQKRKNDNPISLGLKQFLYSEDISKLTTFLDFLIEHLSYFRDYMDEFYSKVVEFKIKNLSLTQIRDLIYNLNFNDSFIFYFSYLFYHKYFDKITDKISLIYFDNLDAISLDYISESFKQYLPDILSKINILANDKHIFKEYNIDFIRKFKLVFCLREANESQIFTKYKSSHNYDRLWSSIIDIFVKFDFNRTYFQNIIKKRVGLLNELNSKHGKYSFLGEPYFNRTSRMLELPIIRDVFLPIYNYDIRKLLILFYSLSTRINIPDKIIDERFSNDLLQSEIKYHLIGVLHKSNFIRNIMDVTKPVNFETGYCEPTRLILTALINKLQIDNKYESSSLKDSSSLDNSVPLYEVIKLFENIYHPEIVISTLLNLFLCHNYGWVNLVSFKGKSIVDESSLNNEKDSILKIYQYREKIMDTSADIQDIKEKMIDLIDLINNVRVVINPSANAYIRYISNSYEYYSILSHHYQHPINQLDFIEKGSSIEFDFEKTFKDVFNTVRNHRELLRIFFNITFRDKLNYGKGSFQHSLFSFKPHQNAQGSLFITRVILSHITFLDKFRLMILSSNPKDYSHDILSAFNEKIVFYIKSYIQLISDPIDNYEELLLDRIPNILRDDISINESIHNKLSYFLEDHNND